MLCKVTYCAGCVSANTKPHQLCWGDQEMGTATSCAEYSQATGLIQKIGRRHEYVTLLHSAYEPCCTTCENEIGICTRTMFGFYPGLFYLRNIGRILYSREPWFKEANWYMTAQQVICFHKRLLSILLATHFFLWSKRHKPLHCVTSVL